MIRRAAKLVMHMIIKGETAISEATATELRDLMWRTQACTLRMLNGKGSESEHTFYSQILLFAELPFAWQKTEAFRLEIRG